MSGFDDIFDIPAPVEAKPDKTFDKKAWGEKKQAERQTVYALADSTASAVGSDGRMLRSFLDTQARFDWYSTTNVLLILAQMPQATQLKDFDGWAEAGASIKKNQHGISILEPGKEYQREDNTRGTSYNVKKVFDISQTTARSKKQPAVNVDERLLLKALIHQPPVAIVTTDELQGNAGAVYDHDSQMLFVRRGMSAPDIFRSVSKELALAHLAASRESYDRKDAAFAAYCVSYMLCRQHGIDVSAYDFSRLPDALRSATPQAIREVLTEIRDTAGEISKRMSRVLEPAKAPKTKGQER